MLFGYACHNTTLTGDNYHVHGDYAGVAQERLEQALPGATALFMIGCAADTNPNPRGTMELGADARWSGSPAPWRATLEGSLALWCRATSAHLCPESLPSAPGRPADSPAAAEARLQDKDTYVRRHARACLRRPSNQKGALPKEYPYPHQPDPIRKRPDAGGAGRRGGRGLQPPAAKREFPPDGKDLGRRLRQRRIRLHTPPSGCCRKARYEAASSMIYYGLPGPWAPEAEEVLVGKVRSMVKKLR